MANRKSKTNIDETLEDIEDFDFLILNQNELFREEKNPSEELVISEEEIAALAPFAIGNKFNEFYTSVASKLVSKIKKIFLSQIYGPKTTRFNIFANHKQVRN